MELKTKHSIMLITATTFFILFALLVLYGIVPLPNFSFFNERAEENIILARLIFIVLLFSVSIIIYGLIHALIDYLHDRKYKEYKIPQEE